MALLETTPPPSQANTPWRGDKSFLLVVVGLIVSVLNGRLNLGLDAGEIAAMLTAIVAFVAGNKWKSGSITVAEIKARNELEVAAITPTTPEAAAKQLGTLGHSAVPPPPKVPPVTR